MRRIITGATGLIGKRLVSQWLQDGHDITVIGRSKNYIQEIFGTRIQAITWDRLTIADLQPADVIINLAGASVGEQRWTEARKQEILHSRVATTTKIATLLATLGHASPPLFNASAIGVYGLQEQPPFGLPPRFEEISAINYDHPSDFLAEVGCKWEQATARAVQAGVRVVNLRFGVVLAKEGGALREMLRPFKLGMGGPIGTGKQPFSWVAIDDVIRAIDFLIAQPDASGPYNIVAPACVTQQQFASALGRVLHRPAVLPLPAFMAKIIFGSQMANELLLNGQHVYPLRLLEINFQYSYPDIMSALTHVLNSVHDKKS